MFTKLIAAFDAEIRELLMAGRNVLHEGAPGQMQRMPRLTMEHAALRDQVTKRYLSWKRGQLSPSAATTDAYSPTNRST